MTSFEAWTRYRLVRTFNCRALAEEYAASMARQGTEITIRKARIERRKAA